MSFKITEIRNNSGKRLILECSEASPSNNKTLVDAVDPTISNIEGEFSEASVEVEGFGAVSLVQKGGCVEFRANNHKFFFFHTGQANLVLTILANGCFMVGEHVHGSFPVPPNRELPSGVYVGHLEGEGVRQPSSVQFTVSKGTFIHGSGKDEEGDYEMEGRYHWFTSEVKFVKKHIGRPALTYEGRYSADDRTMCGTFVPFADALSSSGDVVPCAFEFKFSSPHLPDALPLGQELFEIGMSHLHDGRFDSAIYTYLWYSSHYQNHSPAAIYNVACSHALAGHTEEASRFLRLAFDLGCGFQQHMQTDTDMDSLRDTPIYKEIVDCPDLRMRKRMMKSWRAHNRSLRRTLLAKMMAEADELTKSGRYELALSKLLEASINTSDIMEHVPYIIKLAGTQALAGNKREALYVLKRAAEDGFRISAALRSDPAFDSVREHPVFKSLCNDMDAHREPLAADALQGFVFAFLAPKDLFVLRCVCRRWREDVDEYLSRVGAFKTEKEALASPSALWINDRVRGLTVLPNGDGRSSEDEAQKEMRDCMITHKVQTTNWFRHGPSSRTVLALDLLRGHLRTSSVTLWLDPVTDRIVACDPTGQVVIASVAQGLQRAEILFSEKLVSPPPPPSNGGAEENGEQQEEEGRVGLEPELGEGAVVEEGVVIVWGYGFVGFWNVDTEKCQVTHIHTARSPGRLFSAIDDAGFAQERSTKCALSDGAPQSVEWNVSLRVSPSRQLVAVCGERNNPGSHYSVELFSLETGARIRPRLDGVYGLCFAKLPTRALPKEKPEDGITEDPAKPDEEAPLPPDQEVMLTSHVQGVPLAGGNEEPSLIRAWSTSGPAQFGAIRLRFPMCPGQMMRSTGSHLTIPLRGSMILLNLFLVKGEGDLPSSINLNHVISIPCPVGGLLDFTLDDRKIVWAHTNEGVNRVCACSVIRGDGYVSRVLHPSREGEMGSLQVGNTLCLLGGVLMEYSHMDCLSEEPGFHEVGTELDREATDWAAFVSEGGDFGCTVNDGLALVQNVIERRLLVEWDNLVFGKSISQDARSFAAFLLSFFAPSTVSLFVGPGFDPPTELFFEKHSEWAPKTIEFVRTHKDELLRLACWHQTAAPLVTGSQPPSTDGGGGSSSSSEASTTPAFDPLDFVSFFSDLQARDALDLQIAELVLQRARIAQELSCALGLTLLTESHMSSFNFALDRAYLGAFERTYEVPLPVDTFSQYLEALERDALEDELPLHIRFKFFKQVKKIKRLLGDVKPAKSEAFKKGQEFLHRLSEKYSDESPTNASCVAQ